MSDKAALATALHDKGYNCAQAVACAFCEDFGLRQEDVFRMAEGFGLGMGMMDMCGALSGMAMVVGMQNSVGNPDRGPLTKADTYRKVRELIADFTEQNGSHICRELKGVDTGKVLCPCSQCILDAVALTERYLAEQA